MAKAVFIARMGSVDKVFRETLNNINEIVKDNDNIKQKTSLLLAQDLAQTINENYVANLGKIDSYEHGSANVKTSITDTKKGYIVHISGKDVLYQEYGTGTRGLQNPHPRHKADGMNPYGSGRNIVHNGITKNGTTPHWYELYRDFPGGLNSKGESVRGMSDIKTDFGNEPIRSSDYVWRHNGVITRGLPAGRFVYDSCRKYQKSSGLGDKETLMNTINQSIKKDFVNKMNKEIKKKTKVWDADSIKRRFAYLKMFER